LAIFVSNVCTLSMSILNDRSSIRGFLFTRATCHSEKTLKAHFVELRVDLGIHSFQYLFLFLFRFRRPEPPLWRHVVIHYSLHVPHEGLDWFHANKNSLCYA
jgi:hypothetical protein